MLAYKDKTLFNNKHFIYLVENISGICSYIYYIMKFLTQIKRWQAPTHLGNFV